jgi:predicted nucleic acid-binding protein
LICVFDACALIAFLNMEENFEQVKDLLERAGRGDITIGMSIVNLVEVYYNYIRDDGIAAANATMREALTLPLKIISTISDEVYREAARFKGCYAMSLADAFLCATAKSLSAVIVTKDGEIKPAEQAEALSVLWLS